MSREKVLVKNTFIIAMGQLLPQLTTFIVLPIITGCLTKNEYGEYDLILVLVSFLLPIVTLQIEQAAFRFLIDCREEQEKINGIITNIFLFIFGTSFVILSILFLCLGDIQKSHRVLICIYFYLHILLVAAQQVIRGLSYNKLFSISAISQSIVRMILIVFFVYMGEGGLIGVLMALIISSIIGLGILTIKARLYRKIQLSLLSWRQMKELLKYSWPMVPNTLSAWVLSVSDRVIITFCLGLEMNAIYAVANKIPQLFSVMQGTFIFAWQENASSVLNDSDVSQYYSSIFDKMFRLLVGIMALLIAFTPILFVALIQGDYEQAFYQIPILLMGMFFYSISSFMGGIYIAHKRTLSVGYTTVVAAIINFLTNCFFVNFIGLYAASISTLISYLLLAVFRMRNVQKFQKIVFYNKRIIVLIFVLIVMSALCWTKRIWAYSINMVLGIVLGVLLNRELIQGMFSTLRNRYEVIKEKE